MKRDLLVAMPAMSLVEATQLLITNKITGLPVIDSQRHIIGVITEMDLIRVVANPHRKWSTVAQAMTPDPVTVDINEPLHTVFDCLMTHEFRRVFVKEQGRLAGMISRTDLLPCILDQLVKK